MLETRWLFHFLRISRTRPSASAVMGQTIAVLWVLTEKWRIEPTFRFMLWNLYDRIMKFVRA